MKKHYSKSMFNIRIRPATLDDAEFLLSLRTHPELSRFLGTVKNCIDSQVQWMESYLKKDDDFLFLIESDSGTPMGSIGIYGFEKSQTQGLSAEWGRWVILPEYNIGPISSFLLFSIAFDEIGLDEVWCRTIRDNPKVIRFHNSYAAQRKLHPGFILLDNKKKTRHRALFIQRDVVQKEDLH